MEITPKKLKKLIEKAMADPIKELAISLYTEYNLNEEDLISLLKDKVCATLPYPTTLHLRNCIRDIKKGTIKL